MAFTHFHFQNAFRIKPLEWNFQDVWIVFQAHDQNIWLTNRIFFGRLIVAFIFILSLCIRLSKCQGMESFSRKLFRAALKKVIGENSALANIRKAYEKEKGKDECWFSTISLFWQKSRVLYVCCPTAHILNVYFDEENMYSANCITVNSTKYRRYIFPLSVSNIIFILLR